MNIHAQTCAHEKDEQINHTWRIKIKPGFFTRMGMKFKSLFLFSYTVKMILGFLFGNRLYDKLILFPLMSILRKSEVFLIRLLNYTLIHLTKKNSPIVCFHGLLGGQKIRRTQKQINERDFALTTEQINKL